MYKHDEKIWFDAVGVNQDRIELLVTNFSKKMDEKNVEKSSQLVECIEEFIIEDGVTGKEKAAILTLWVDKVIKSRARIIRTSKSFQNPIPILRGIAIAVAIFLIGASFIQENWLALIAWISIVVYHISDLLTERIS